MIADALATAAAHATREPDPDALDATERARVDALVRDHEPTLLAVASRLCGGDRDRAADLVQDTFERAIRNLGRNLGAMEPAGQRAWLIKVLHNRFVDECRRRRRAPGHVPVTPDADVAAPAPEPAPAWGEITADELRAAVARLDDEFRAVYELHALRGWSYDDIARELGIAKATVGTRLLRARRKLRRLLAEVAP